jgi:hypothetical protein
VSQNQHFKNKQKFASVSNLELSVFQLFRSKSEWRVLHNQGTPRSISGTHLGTLAWRRVPQENWNEDQIAWHHENEWSWLWWSEIRNSTRRQTIRYSWRSLVWRRSAQGTSPRLSEILTEFLLCPCNFETKVRRNLSFCVGELSSFELIYNNM